MTLERNGADREGPADFARRRGLTYSVLSDPGGDVIGCAYIYVSPLLDVDAVRSWVRASRAELDIPLNRTVTAWLESALPFATYDDAPRAMA
jgi:hypothetical protein